MQWHIRYPQGIANCKGEEKDLAQFFYVGISTTHNHLSSSSSSQSSSAWPKVTATCLLSTQNLNVKVFVYHKSCISISLRYDEQGSNK